jgi:hypothetical protein
VSVVTVSITKVKGFRRDRFGLWNTVELFAMTVTVNTYNVY